nr:type I 3-dehydroquinate dehydratase [Secundilactobacillus oryzae]
MIRKKIRETANLLHNILGDLPLIVSLRNPSEGGHQTVSDAAYQQLISQLITSHTANAVEINWSRPAPIRQQLANLARVNQVLTLGSYYSIQNTPDYDHLVQILTHLAREQTNFLKLTTMPQNDQDVLNLMSANLTVSEKIDQPISTIALGPKALPHASPVIRFTA